MNVSWISSKANIYSEEACIKAFLYSILFIVSPTIKDAVCDKSSRISCCIRKPKDVELGGLSRISGTNFSSINDVLNILSIPRNDFLSSIKEKKQSL